jgi:hypothetical protein
MEARVEEAVVDQGMDRHAPPVTVPRRCGERYALRARRASSP